MPHSSNNQRPTKSVAASPKAFSSKSLVRDSGVFIPTKRTRALYVMSKPKSSSTSMVSPSTTRKTLARY